ncbi:MAG: MBL fold metallo-hydrolase, partial [Acidimicrobiia bacterium]|nr:MBL fold metallo-hydrolase [Acidimicrobiia bacterium]
TEAAIVDTGFEGSAPAIEQGLSEAGVGWSNVGHVILTHRHPDHIGSLSAVADAAHQADLGAGAADIDAMTSPRPIDALADGQDVFGLQVVATPGHTPGHISVFDAATQILVAGDAINRDGASVPVVNGVGGPNPQFTPDMDTAVESTRKLAALNPDTIFFGHGEPKVGGAAAALQELVDGL